MVNHLVSSQGLETGRTLHQRYITRAACTATILPIAHPVVTLKTVQATPQCNLTK